MIQKGYIAIMTVLILSVVLLAAASTVALLAIGEAQSAFALFKGEDSLQFVEGCTDDALLKARSDINYNGGNITRPEGTCVITSPITKAGNEWTMTVSTNDTKYRRTVQVVFNRLSTGITLISWREI